MTVWVLIVYTAVTGSGNVAKTPVAAYTSEASCKADGRHAVAIKQIGSDEIFICQPLPVVQPERR